MRSLASQSSEASYLCIYYPATDPEFPEEAPTRRRERQTIVWRKVAKTA